MYFDGPRLTVSFAVQLGQDGSSQIALSPAADGTGHIPDFRDGDPVSVTVVDASGATLLDRSGTAHYEHQDDCFSGCTVGSVDL